MTIKKLQAISTQETRVVTEIYKQKNISKASIELGMTSNYVNVTLLRLEEKLGCCLFHRRQKTGVMELTNLGNIILPKLKEITEAYLWVIENIEKNK